LLLPGGSRLQSGCRKRSYVADERRTRSDADRSLRARLAISDRRRLIASGEVTLGSPLMGPSDRAASAILSARGELSHVQKVPPADCSPGGTVAFHVHSEARGQDGQLLEGGGLEACGGAARLRDPFGT